MVASAQELFHVPFGTGPGLIDWRNGTGTVAHSQAPERFPGHDNDDDDDISEGGISDQTIKARVGGVV